MKLAKLNKNVICLSACIAHISDKFSILPYLDELFNGLTKNSEVPSQISYKRVADSNPPELIEV